MPTVCHLGANHIEFKNTEHAVEFLLMTGLKGEWEKR